MNQRNFATKHELNNWSTWSKDMNNAIHLFKDKYGALPSYISANEHTHSQIDFITGISTEKGMPDNLKLTHFIFEKQFIDFVYDTNIRDKTFELQYDPFFESDKLTSFSQKKIRRNVTIFQGRC